MKESSPHARLPVSGKLPPIFLTLSVSRRPLPSALQSHSLDFLTIAELYPLYVSAHSSSQLICGYLQTLRLATITKKKLFSHGDHLLQEIIWSLSLLKRYTRNLTTLRLSNNLKQSDFSIWQGSGRLTAVADLQAEIVHVNQQTFQQLFSLPCLKNKTLLDEQLACSRLSRFNPHANGLTDDEIKAVCSTALYDHGNKLESWDELSTVGCKQNGAPIPITVVKGILMNSAALRTLIIDRIPREIAPFLSHATNLEYLTVGIRTTEASYPSMIPVIAELGRELTLLRSLDVYFFVIAPLDLSDVVIEEWEFRSSLTSLQIRGSVDEHSDLDGDFGYRHLPLIIKAPSLLIWRGSISLLGFANLLQFSPDLEEVTGDIGCKYEFDVGADGDKDGTRFFFHEDIGLKAIKNAFLNGYGSNLKIIALVEGSTPWPPHLISSMISCCPLLTELSLFLTSNKPIEPTLRLLSNLKALRFLKIKGSHRIRITSNTAALATEQETNCIHFPVLYELALCVCDDQLLTDLDIPSLRSLQLFSAACNISSFDFIQERFPDLSDLCILGARVSWDKDKQQAIEQPVRSIPQVKSSLVYLQVVSEHVNMNMLRHLLLRSPLCDLSIHFSIAKLMRDIITKTDSHYYPWPFLKFISILYENEATRSTDEIAELVINLARGIPALTELQLPESGPDEQKAILDKVDDQLTRPNMNPLKVTFAE